MHSCIFSVKQMPACHLSDRCQGVLRSVVAPSAVRHYRDAARRSPGPKDAAGLVRWHRRKPEHHHEDVEECGEEGGPRGAPRAQHHQQKHRREIHHLIPDLQHDARRICVCHDRTGGWKNRCLETDGALLSAGYMVEGQTHG